MVLFSVRSHIIVTKTKAECKKLPKTLLEITDQLFGKGGSTTTPHQAFDDLLSPRIVLGAGEPLSYSYPVRAF